MTQKQTIGVVVGVLVLGTMFTFVYQQFAAPAPRSGTLLMEEQPKAPVSVREKKAAEPETIDGIAESIQAETAADLSALDDEANGEISEIETDSESVNNLGTSYDENNL